MFLFLNVCILLLTLFSVSILLARKGHKRQARKGISPRRGFLLENFPRINSILKNVNVRNLIYFPAHLKMYILVFSIMAKRSGLSEAHFMSHTSLRSNLIRLPSLPCPLWLASEVSDVRLPSRSRNYRNPAGH